MSMNPLRRRSTEAAPAARDETRPVVTERDDLFRDRKDSRDFGLRDDDTRPGLRHDDTRPDPRYDDPRPGLRHDDTRVDGERVDGERVVGAPTDQRVDLAVDRASVVAREREAFGGLKLGAAFFGWLTALGTAVLLSALVAAVVTGARVASGDGVTTDPATVVAGTGLRTDVAIIAVLFVAYYCGGYVAGRMSRFDGAKQGLAVWVLALAAALLITGVGAVAGANWDLLGTLNGFPRLSGTTTTITSGGVVTTLIALAAALVGAVLGGLGGMRFHRRVDRAGLGR